MCTPWNRSSSLWEHNALCLSALLLHILIYCGESRGCWLSEPRGRFSAFFMVWVACDSQECHCCSCVQWGQSTGACWSLERCILLAVEHMCSYIPELTQAEKDCISASKMSYCSFEVKWARGSQFHMCHAQFIKQSTCMSTTHKLTLPLLRCWEHFEWVNKK